MNYPSMAALGARLVGASWILSSGLSMIQVTTTFFTLGIAQQWKVALTSVLLQGVLQQILYIILGIVLCRYSILVGRVIAKGLPF